MDIVCVCVRSNRLSPWQFPRILCANSVKEIFDSLLDSSVHTFFLHFFFLFLPFISHPFLYKSDVVVVKKDKYTFESTTRV